MDLRSNAEYRSSTYPGAVNVEKDVLLNAVKEGEDFVSFIIGETIREEQDHRYDLDSFIDDERIEELMIGQQFLDGIYSICLMAAEEEGCWALTGKMRKMGFRIWYLEGGFLGYQQSKMQNILHDSDQTDQFRLRAERSLITKFRKSLWRPFVKAIQDYELIKDGDRIAVCISGGKDSMLMAKLFQELERHGKKNFELRYLVMDPGYNSFNRQRIEDNANLLGIPIEVFETDIFAAVDNVDDSPCYLCARMRRGYLYDKAKELGCNKIALGHHFDDVIETILMGMLYGGQVQTMMPKLHSIHFAGMELIRPLYYIRESDIIHWRDYCGLFFIACACRNTERGGGLMQDSKRGEIKGLIRELASKNEFVEKNIFRSVENVNLATIISYKQEGKVTHFLNDYDTRGISEDERN
ncbi:MAG: ATPase [Lachnospiraceae bacterium]|nr:ATPase [Lachnospiraceae bacterium]